MPDLPRSDAVRPLTIAEWDLDWVADADIGPINPDGTPCYRTPATTAGAIGPTAWRPIATRTRRFCDAAAPAVWTLDAIPCLREIRVEAAKLELGESLGAFGQVTITLDDFADDDQQEDPFHAQRAAPPGRGSYLARLAARNPYVEGRPLRVITRDAAHPDQPDQIRHYLVRSFARSARGAWTLVGVSPLQLLNLRGAKAPKAIGWRLAAFLPAGASTAALESWSVQPTDPTSGTLRLGDEVADFTRDGATLTLARGQAGTAPADHDAGDAPQPALRFTDATIPQVLRTLLVDHAGVAPAFIPMDAWQAETAAWLAQYRLSPPPLTEAVAVVDLINELCQQVGLILWYDEQSRTIRLQVLRPVPSHLVTTLTDDDLVGEVGIATDLGRRISQVEVLFAPRGAGGSNASAADFRRRLLSEAQGESRAEHGSAAPLAIQSRWFDLGDDTLAARTAATLLGQRRDGRTTYTIAVSQRHAHLDLGSVVRLVTRDLVDPAGNPQPTYAFIISRSPPRSGTATIGLTAERFPLVTRYAYAMAAGAGTYAATPDAAREPGWFLSAADGRMPGGDPGYALG